MLQKSSPLSTGFRMRQQIRFEIPDEVDENDFESYFRDHIDEFSEALDHSAYEHDHRSQVEEIELLSIELSPDSVTIYYEVEISAYHGCRDMSYAESVDRDVVARREGRVFFFDEFEYPERRNTYDEF